MRKRVSARTCSRRPHLELEEAAKILQSTGRLDINLLAMRIWGSIAAHAISGIHDKTTRWDG